MIRFLIPFLLLGSLALADEIIFWKAPPARDATILKIEEGLLYYEVDGEAKRERLMNVRAITKAGDDEVAAADADAVAGDRPGRLLPLREVEENRSTGQAIGVRMRPGRGRIYEPLVRVYLLQEDERGARQVTLYQNIRGIRDPSRLEDVEQVDTQAYRQRWFFFPTERLVAWRSELWYEGELIDSAGEQQERAGKMWWRLADRVRSASLRDVEAPPAEREASTETTFRITRARIVPQLGQDSRASFVVAYTIQGDESVSPQVSIHYVLQTADGRLRVRSAACRGEVDDGGDRRECRLDLPEEVVLSGGQFERGDDPRLKLAYWRVNVIHDNEVVAFREASDSRFKAQLPEDWWK